jgi:hypothetical protein
VIRPLSEAETKANWQAVRRYLRRYFIAAMLPLLAALWGAGYGQGLIEGGRDCPPAIRKERDSL